MSNFTLFLTYQCVLLTFWPLLVINSMLTGFYPMCISCVKDYMMIYAYLFIYYMVLFKNLWPKWFCDIHRLAKTVIIHKVLFSCQYIYALHWIETWQWFSLIWWTNIQTHLRDSFSYWFFNYVIKKIALSCFDMLLWYNEQTNKFTYESPLLIGSLALY